MKEQQLREVIRTEVKEVLQKELRDLVMREIEVEKGPRKQGDPEVKRIVKEDWNVIDYMAGYIPYLEGALRGVQADTDSAKNTSAKALEGIKAMAEILETTHKSITAIANFADDLRQLPDLETQVVRIIQNKMASAKVLPFDPPLLNGEIEEVKNESNS